MEFEIGKYKDNVICDVVPMQVSHIILIRPWQFNKYVVFHGKLSRCVFHHNDQKVTLVPHMPKEV